MTFNWPDLYLPPINLWNLPRRNTMITETINFRIIAVDRIVQEPDVIFETIDDLHAFAAEQGAIDYEVIETKRFVVTP